jgi:hypothetical protein
MVRNFHRVVEVRGVENNCRRLVVAIGVVYFIFRIPTAQCTSVFPYTGLDVGSRYTGIVAPKFSATGNTGMFGPIDSDETFSNDPEYRAAAMVGHLGFPIHHAYYAPYFTNCADEVLNGDKTEVFTFPNEPDDPQYHQCDTRHRARAYATQDQCPGNAS